MVLRKGFLCLGLLLLITLVSLSVPGHGLTKAALYKDKNGLFVLLPPDGWTRQDYPAETVRSKVAFHRPPGKTVTIRVMAMPVSRTFTLDELIRQSENGIKNVQRQYPNVRCSFRKDRVAGRRVAIATISGPGSNHQRIVTFQEGNVLYNIGYGGRAKAVVQRHSKTFDMFMDNFTALGAGKKFSDAEVRASFVAGVLRVAQLREQQGAAKAALELVTQALTFAPENEQLKALAKRLRSR